MTNKSIERLRDKLMKRGMAASHRPPPLEPEWGPQMQAITQRVRPFAEAMYLVLAADGDIDERERDVLRGALRTLTDGQLSTRAMASMLGDFARLRSRDGVELRLDSVAAALYGDRKDAELVLGLMAAAAETDGQVGSGEQSIIMTLGERLGVAVRHLEELLYGPDGSESG
jgi:uncharacterized membrane protein YebE (DUF533 family)